MLARQCRECATNMAMTALSWQATTVLVALVATL
jgi:hypothetical protein